ncbi:substrate-binding domain-containing protein [Streptomyces sp. NPDC057565]|uniref:substrate-binding domain-containing protein n=1 Tax=Streptomyces sp. NPDC057565 TaxID=3346169 RepID=UPI00369D2DC7
MAARGIGFLGWNTRYRGHEPDFVLDRALVDIGVGVRWLKKEAGVEYVILLGNSGGGSLMAAYHSQAVEPCVRPAPGGRPAPSADDLIPGDAYVSRAAHLERPDVITKPALTVVAQETSIIGQTTVELLRARMADPNRPVQTVVVPVSLKIRGSGEVPA